MSQHTQQHPERHDLAALRDITGSFRDAKTASHILAECARVGHLISPATVVATMPPGLEIAISAVMIDSKLQAYTPPGSSKLALLKSGLDAIAGAAGVSWDSQRSGIVHQERNRIVFTSCGTIRDLDGREREISGTKDMDVRDDSPAVHAMIETCIGKSIRGRMERGKELYTEDEAVRRGEEAAWNAIRQLRQHLLSHAETKSGQRALRRGCGLRAAYEPAELLKPFLVAKMAFTGRCEDPATNKMFAEKIADSFMADRRAMYRTPPGGMQRAEVIDVRNSDEIAADGHGEDEREPNSPRGTIERGGNEEGTRRERAPEPATRNVAAPTTTPPASSNAGNHPPISPPTGGDRVGPGVPPPTSRTTRLPKKGGAGDLLCDASDKDLLYWESRLRDSIDSGENPQYEQRNRATLEAIEDELCFRGVES